MKSKNTMKPLSKFLKNNVILVVAVFGLIFLLVMTAGKT